MLAAEATFTNGYAAAERLQAQAGLEEKGTRCCEIPVNGHPCSCCLKSTPVRRKMGQAWPTRVDTDRLMLRVSEARASLNSRTSANALPGANPSAARLELPSVDLHFRSSHESTDMNQVTIKKL